MRPLQVMRGPLLVAIAVAILLLAGCSPSTGGGEKAAPPGPSGESQGEPQGQEVARADYIGQMSLSPTNGPAGTLVTVTADGLPASTSLDLVWNTVKGSWVLKGKANEEYHGRQFDPTTVLLAKVDTDPQGHLETSFEVPADFGFMHDVTLVQDGVVRNQAAFSVDMEVEVSPLRGPSGTPIVIDVRGIGWQSLENSWMVLYDNKFTGFLSAVTTGGQAGAVIPAAGGPGKHVLQIVHGSFTVPYLNGQQSPRPDRPIFTQEFIVTGDALILPAPLASQGLAPERGTPPAGDGPAVWVNPASGQVGTPIEVAARGLPGGETVRFTWSRVVGNRVSGQGWEEAVSELQEVKVEADGTARFTMPALDDLGGPHPITVRSGETVLAETSFTITPSALAITPAAGPAGTDITVHLKGVGWTETANIYHAVYDNSYIGYACGFNSQGDVEIHLPATGEPGWHFIDLYPGIYKGKEVPGVQNFRIPQLSYDPDHPGERLPAFRLAFQVTE